MIRSIIRAVIDTFGNLIFPYNYKFKEWIRRIYYHKLGFGWKCECGRKLLGGKHCLSYTHEQDVSRVRRDNKLKTILK